MSRDPDPAGAGSFPGPVLVVQPTPFGGRLVFHRRAADAAYWDEMWENRPLDHRRARAGHLPRHLRRAVEREVPPGSRVLEAGCGQGHFTVAMAARGFAAEAVDWAPRTVERLRAAAPDLRVWRGDVRWLDVPDGRYDAVYSPGVCEHFEEGPEEVLRETFRVLRPGGVALVSTPCFSPLLRLLRGAGWPTGPGGRGAARPPATPPEGDPPGAFYQYAFPPAELTAVLRGIGFERVRAHPYGALATVLEFTGPGRALASRVPQARMRPLDAALDLAGAARLSGRACLWVARRPRGGPSPSAPGRRPAVPLSLPSPPPSPPLPSPSPALSPSLALAPSPEPRSEEGPVR